VPLPPRRARGRGRQGATDHRGLVERGAHLLFSGIDDAGNALDQETMDKRFGLGGKAAPFAVLARTQEPLSRDAAQYTQATACRPIEQNNVHFQAVSPPV